MKDEDFPDLNARTIANLVWLAAEGKKSPYIAQAILINEPIIPSLRKMADEMETWGAPEAMIDFPQGDEG